MAIKQILPQMGKRLIIIIIIVTIKIIKCVQPADLAPQRHPQQNIPWPSINSYHRTIFYRIFRVNSI